MDNDLALVQLSAANKALAECRTVMEAKRIADVADAARIYLERTRAGVQTVNRAVEVRILAERQMGKFLDRMDKAKGTLKRGPVVPQGNHGEQTLSDIGITKKQSSRAQKLADMSESDFNAALGNAKSQAERLTVKAVVQQAATARRPAKVYQGGIVKCLTELSGQTFGCIYADPPWKYDNQSTRAATNNHYATLSPEEISRLPVKALAADKAHLHLWVTNAFLESAFSIIQAWGFEFKSTFVWVKPQMGIGNYWRNSHEIMLTATRGGQTAISKSEMSWLECDRGAHSSKPDQVRERIMRLSPGPYLELFGRREVKGWTIFGNEVEHELV